jgi:hypothetical protein
MIVGVHTANAIRAELSTIRPAGQQPKAGRLSVLWGLRPAGWLDWLRKLSRLGGLKGRFPNRESCIDFFVLSFSVTVPCIHAVLGAQLLVNTLS